MKISKILGATTPDVVSHSQTSSAMTKQKAENSLIQLLTETVHQQDQQLI